MLRVKERLKIILPITLVLIFGLLYMNTRSSFKAAVVQSDGTFDHTRFHASGDPTFSPVNEVSIDDVNGTLTILDASPTVTNSSFDGSAALVDMIRVGGKASPVFDHVHVIDAHCAFQFGAVRSEEPAQRRALHPKAEGVAAQWTTGVHRCDRPGS